MHITLQRLLCQKPYSFVLNLYSAIPKPLTIAFKRKGAVIIVSSCTAITLIMQAQQKALAPDVLDLANKMETAHIKLTEELRMYASEQGWLIPAGEL